MPRTQHGLPRRGLCGARPSLQAYQGCAARLRRGRRNAPDPPRHGKDGGPIPNSLRGAGDRGQRDSGIGDFDDRFAPAHLARLEDPCQPAFSASADRRATRTGSASASKIGTIRADCIRQFSHLLLGRTRSVSAMSCLIHVKVGVWAASIHRVERCDDVGVRQAAGRDDRPRDTGRDGHQVSR